RDNAGRSAHAYISVTFLVQAPCPTSRPAQRDLQSRTQVLLTVWLKQDLDSAVAAKGGPHTLIPLRGDENDRHFLAPASELALQLRSRDTRHSDVQDQAVCLFKVSGVQEFFR